MKRILWDDLSVMNTKNGLLISMTGLVGGNIPLKIISAVVTAAASVPFSLTLRIA